MFERMVIKTGKLLNSFYNIFIVLISKRKKNIQLFLILFPVSII